MLANVLGLPSQRGVRPQPRLHAAVLREALGFDVTTLVECRQELDLVILERQHDGEEIPAFAHELLQPPSD